MRISDVIRKIHNRYMRLSKRIRDSIIFSVGGVGLISTFASILGVSLGDLNCISIWVRLMIAVAIYVVIGISFYHVVGKIYADSVEFTIRGTTVSVCSGDIFQGEGLRVIGCDTHYDTRIDDIVISKKSLHGKLFLEHGDIEEIKKVTNSEAKRLGLQKNKDDLFDFPLGTIICYDSNVDDRKYLMLSMTKLNDCHEAHTNMAEFELMLMRMWKEISRVYAGYEVVLPLLGAGITRFDDGPQYKDALLRCMLCTLNSSGVSLKSKVTILIYGDIKDIPLYEYKEIFHMIPGR